MAWSYNTVTVNGKQYSQNTSVTLPAGTRYYDSADGKTASGTGTLSSAKTVYYYGYNDVYVGRDGYDPAPYYFCASSGGSPTGSGGWKYMKAADLPKATYTISYNANGGSGAPSSQTKTYGTALTLSGTKPTRTGYTFKNWNTAANGSGTNYNSSASYTANAAATLYAQWTAVTYNVTIDCNGGSGVSSRTYNIETANFTLGTPTRAGYTFTGWTGSNGSTPQKTVTISKGNTGNKSYTANWSENKLTVNYYSNYATYATFQGSAVSVNANSNVLVHSQDFYYDDGASNGLSDIQNADYIYMTRTGYTSTGNWGTSTNGGTLINQSTSYTDSQALAKALGKDLTNGNASIDLYAQWKINTYTFNYNANKGTGSMSSHTVNWNDVFTPSANAFKREGYKFLGWNAYRHNDNKWYVSNQGWLTESEITAGGYEKKIYNTQDPLTFNIYWIEGNESVVSQYTYYAVWEISGVIYIDNSTSFEPYLTYIDNGTGWDLYLAYVDNGTNWDIMS